MVLRRIEVDHFVARTAFDDDVAQRFAPLRDGARMHGVEIQFGHLGERLRRAFATLTDDSPDGYRERPTSGAKVSTACLSPSSRTSANGSEKRAAKNTY